MSFLRTRRNSLNSFFFQKFQAQVSQAPGFKPMLSYEDFLRLVQAQNQVQASAEGVLPPLSTEHKTIDLSENVMSGLHKTWDSKAE